LPVGWYPANFGTYVIGVSCASSCETNAPICYYLPSSDSFLDSRNKCRARPQNSLQLSANRERERLAVCLQTFLKQVIPVG
jgi:hypothetical protein